MGRTVGVEIAAALAVATITAQCPGCIRPVAPCTAPRFVALVGTGRQQLAARSVRMGYPRDGVVGVYATVRAAEGWAVHEVLERTARAMRQHGDARDLDTLRADLFVEWMTGSKAAPSAAAAPSHWRSRDGWEPWTGAEPPSAGQPEPDRWDPAWDDLPTTGLLEHS